NDFKTYRKQVLKHFDIYPLVFKFILMKITGTFNLVKNSLDLLRIYHHMKNNQDRYGMEVKIADMMKVSSI
ncbi:MAG TPA: NAD(P)/FAD-dependent oxidoreductase, partial [Nitrososphaeraceae archaeon]|nr:NAD(P)/FAD-dependent oxidoreductase [Nitrososphaeraceae archaeon]